MILFISIIILVFDHTIRVASINAIGRCIARIHSARTRQTSPIGGDRHSNALFGQILKPLYCQINGQISLVALIGRLEIAARIQTIGPAGCRRLPIELAVYHSPLRIKRILAKVARISEDTAAATRIHGNDVVLFLFDLGRARTEQNLLYVIELFLIVGFDGLLRSVTVERHARQITRPVNFNFALGLLADQTLKADAPKGLRTL
jgi:hypothetical protein